MIAGVLFPIAALAILVVLAVVFFQRRDAVDLSPPSLLRAYLYLASLAGILTLTIGLASLANAGLAQALGPEVIYGGSVAKPVPALVRCPDQPGGCEQTPAQLAHQRQQDQEQRERRRAEDLLRGITFTAFGALVWGAHRAARRGLDGTAEASGVRRAYLMLGTITFGLATVILLPSGLYQALAGALLPAAQYEYRQGADSLGGGLACLPVWLGYLRTLRRDVRPAGAVAG